MTREKQGTKLGLFNLKMRWLREDLVIVFKERVVRRKMMVHCSQSEMGTGKK